jgi:hypothetical protein
MRESEVQIGNSGLRSERRRLPSPKPDYRRRRIGRSISTRGRRAGSFGSSVTPVTTTSPAGQAIVSIRDRMRAYVNRVTPLTAQPGEEHQYGSRSDV